MRLDANLDFVYALMCPACNLLPSSGWVTKEDVFSYQAANIAVSGSVVTITPLTPQTWKNATGTYAQNQLVRCR